MKESAMQQTAILSICCFNSGRKYSFLWLFMNFFNLAKILSIVQYLYGIMFDWNSVQFFHLYYNHSASEVNNYIKVHIFESVSFNTEIYVAVNLVIILLTKETWVQIKWYNIDWNKKTLATIIIACVVKCR